MMFPNKYLSAMKCHDREPLQQLEDQWGLHMSKSSKDGMKFLEREFRFFDIFLTLQSFTDLRDMLDVTHKVQSLFQDAAVDLKKVNKIQHVDRVIFRIQEKIRMTKLEIRAVYSFTKVSANKDDIATPNFVLEFIDTVLGNLEGLVSFDIGGVFKELKLLRNFVCFVSDRCIEPHSLHTFFSHILVVAGHAAMVAWLYLPSENQDLAPDEINVLLSDLLLTKIKPILPDVCKIYIDVLRALRLSIQSQGCPIIQIEHVADCGAGFVETLQHNLKELPTINNSGGIVASTDQIVALQEMLNLLISKLIHLSRQDLEFHLQDIDTVMVYYGLLVYSLYEHVALWKWEATQRRRSVLKLNLRFRYLSREVDRTPEPSLSSATDVTLDLLKKVIYHIIRKEFQSNLPRIHGLGYVDFVLNNLKEFQERYPNSLAFVKAQLQMIQKELDSLQPFLRCITVRRHYNHDKLQHSMALLIGKAYEVEYIVDACVSNKVPDWCLMLWILDLIEEIGTEVAAIQVLEVDLVSYATMATDTSPTSSVLARTQRVDEEIVGFEDEIEILRRRLIGGGKDLDVISIVGMPGVGKTALANRLYFDKSVISHFDIRAQCYVSSVYSRRDLLLSILAMLPLSIDESSLLSKGTDDLADILQKILKCTRYLILVDDIWDARAWNDLKLCFYDAKNGSRILLTTRHHNVANDAKSVSEPLCLRVLDDGKSWKLLKKKVFGEDGCSPVLEKIGPKLAGKCGGLPLSIVFLACILSRMEKTEEYWKQVARNLGSKISCYPEKIIEQSYQNLPYHLKSCFLYFGMFSDQEEINISKLTFLWIGEGFVKDDEGKSLEDIAKGYLKNLVESSLVMFAKWSCGGKIKVCRIHDILFHFCKARSQKENFIQRIERNQGDIFSPKQLTQRRLALYVEADNLEQWSSSGSLVGSALVREASTNSSSLNSQALNVFHNFKFLKVLDLEFTLIDSFPTELVYLRYFAARTSQDSVTPSIVNLWNLETLIVKRMGGKLSLPITLWKMVKLRNLHIDNAYFTLNGAEGLFENSSNSVLETLCSPYFSCAEDVEMILRKSPNLRELRCSFMDFMGTRFPKLDFLTRLETLKILCATGSTIGGVYNFPSNLKSLTLNGFHLDRYHVSNLARLPKLQVLKLESILFDGNEWEVSNDEFPQLKVLKIVKCDHFKQWIVVDDAFLSLERLVLCECTYLKQIPSCFGDVSYLKSIEVKYCNESVDKSARQIKHTKVELLGNSDFDVFISSRRRKPFSGDDGDNGGGGGDDDVDKQEKKKKDEY